MRYIAFLLLYLHIPPVTKKESELDHTYNHEPARDIAPSRKLTILVSPPHNSRSREINISTYQKANFAAVGNALLRTSLGGLVIRTYIGA